MKIRIGSLYLTKNNIAKHTKSKLLEKGSRHEPQINRYRARKPIKNRIWNNLFWGLVLDPKQSPESTKREPNIKFVFGVGQTRQDAAECSGLAVREKLT